MLGESASHTQSGAAFGPKESRLAAEVRFLPSSARASWRLAPTAEAESELVDVLEGRVRDVMDKAYETSCERAVVGRLKSDA